MQKAELGRDVCQAYCSFYKPGKDEELACRGLIVLQKLLELDGEIPVAKGKERPSSASEEILFIKLCGSCPFADSDCDFAAWKRSKKTEITADVVSPCGGFVFLGLCIDNKTLDLNKLDQLI